MEVAGAETLIKVSLPLVICYANSNIGKNSIV
jgi:hypothetical protein